MSLYCYTKQMVCVLSREKSVFAVKFTHKSQDIVSIENVSFIVDTMMVWSGWVTCRGGGFG